LPYTKVLRRDDEGDVVATIAELDGCMAHGEDEAEALRNLNEAQVAWIEAALTAGQNIPQPEVEEELPSGKFVVRLARSVHRRLNALAKKEGVSLNHLVVIAVSEYVTRIETREESRFEHMWSDRVGAFELHSPHAQVGDFMKAIQQRGVIAETVEATHALHAKRGH
jgi:predicted RNase H-like HicB family nuclease